MQLKFFDIQAPGGEHLIEEMNLFLRTKKVLTVDRRLVTTERGTFWHICIEYIEQAYSAEQKEKVDNQVGFSRAVAPKAPTGNFNLLNLKIHV